ncbi:NAD(P)/FAD-dependent oxidoreductase [Aphanothece sacrum]|uniref:FAD dependent oxidoreductase n=1 Tax=Aphanothece sacrum FPU1 TaxID=1920663 RepID=A0A401IM72_APHSA|nr:FAD-dependent oxidoreductase [Aphanothece sacrum]GBF82335.1 FAD dependent oxidoreductase [Aphanothece sacrum FPU1]GBF84235.1 FAD dependent oxidoreductase [Aphanothece sacrum FPU3]
MTKIVIIGAGIIGAAIAYELSLIEGLNITLIDEKKPASGSTGAALGVLMGIISHKTRGRGWKLRQNSWQRYETLISELESLIGESIPVNRQGILSLRFVDESLESWESLAKIRANQGYSLEIWDAAKLHQVCPQIQSDRVVGAIYSPQDRQINPTVLTQALVKGASLRGVNCNFGVTVQKILTTDIEGANNRQCYQVQTTEGTLDTDWLVIAAGLGSTGLTASLTPSVDIRPVLGQALQISLNQPLGNPEFQPVITGDDVHIVPVGKTDYWVGATVEFPNTMGEVIPGAELLEKVRQQAISFCPSLGQGEVVYTWLGKRPRPEGEPAPIIKELPNYSHILLATGHYRNGVLLAPATALAIRDKIMNYEL